MGDRLTSLLKGETKVSTGELCNLVSSYTICLQMKKEYNLSGTHNTFEQRSASVLKFVLFHSKISHRN